MQPPRPRGFAVLFLLIILVVAVLTMTVLFANEGRNILALAKALDIDLRFGRTSGPAAEPADLTGRPAANAGWPWRPLLIAEGIALQPNPAPAEICNSIAEDGQEPPSLVTGESGSWECTNLREYAAPEGRSSLFVQMRGMQDGTFSGFRIKFNLGDGGMRTSLGDEASRLVAAGIRPLPASADMEAALKQKLMSGTDFYFLLGYYPITFKQEISEATRFNMIAVNRPVPASELSRRPIAATARADADRNVRIGKGSRLSSLATQAP
ncbi:DUF6030 family protein [Neorhizobium sp. CSC1952]|uniref:DUF6030 family protein n=1 Tax=Neorhizobium sp. CSC1952 TaxID=2978974 RepID=UPI0025A5683B|nr:DUF6030 family protein [Rhizobium sp. CSC1952]WJR67346.1 DUF6030 family protein [Rhizobium sp. CSC1952]